MFKNDGEYVREDGFRIPTIIPLLKHRTEIRSLGPKTLQVVVSTLIESAKRWNANQNKCQGEEKENSQRKSVKILTLALRVFEQAPAKHSLKDRSVVFPGYSYMGALIAAGDANAPDNQTPADFENDLVSKFLHETRFQLFHNCRSLSLKADVLARYGDFNTWKG